MIAEKGKDAFRIFDRSATMRLICLFLFSFVVLNTAAQASECLALAEGLARVQPASLRVNVLASNEVSVRFVGHSTFRIETAGGVVAATDFNGNAGGATPDVVTMNRAHSTHYTSSPDPAIKHVLRGWGEDGAPAKHDVDVGDLRIRNVTTDIRFGSAQRVTDGNSIFIFESAGLCIGHLGHLHHELTPGHIGWIGRLDVVMVPVDGRMTMPHANMMAVLKDIKAAVVIPMHIFGPTTLAAFLEEARKSFKVTYLDSRDVTFSSQTLPTEPTVMVMPGY
jgi:L-ascorbate metabolism protein UlaG (beta-lactamase superfamily)